MTDTVSKFSFCVYALCNGSSWSLPFMATGDSDAIYQARDSYKRLDVPGKSNLVGCNLYYLGAYDFLAAVDDFKGPYTLNPCPDLVLKYSDLFEDKKDEVTDDDK